MALVPMEFHDNEELIMEQKNAATITLGAGAWQNVGLNVSKTGYKPLMANALSTYNTDVVLLGSGMNDATNAIATVRNIANANKNVTVQFQILYKKN